MARCGLGALLVGLAACGSLESDEAKEVARVTQESVERGVDAAKEQLDKVDTEKIAKTWDGVVEAVQESTQREPSASPAEPAPDPLADAAKAIACDEARERCTVTTEFASRARQHGGRVAAQVRISPARGDVRGIRIDAIDAGTIAELVGLRVGDVVTHVNGTSLGSPQDAMLLYMSMRAARAFTVDYRRDGQARTLQVEII
jgi:type II secretory pathway component PulC